MAITTTILAQPHTVGNRWRTVSKIALDNSYPTGGYAVTPQALGLGSNSFTADPEASVEIDNSLGYGARYDFANQKILLYSSAGTQVTNATDVSAVTDMRVQAMSRIR